MGKKETLQLPDVTPEEFNKVLLKACKGKLGSLKFSHDGVSYEFATCVVPWDFNEDFVLWSNFSGFDKIGQIAFVSSDVPEQWRPHVMWHSVMCCHIRKDRPDRCLLTTAEELANVPAGDQLLYAKMRIESYESMLQNFVGHLDAEMLEGTLKLLKAYCGNKKVLELVEPKPLDICFV